MSPNDDTVLADSIEDELGIFGAEMIETLLDDMIAIQVLDQINDLAFQSMDDGLNLANVSDLSYERSRELLTCPGVEMNSIIFCKALVPCWLKAIFTICGAALLMRTVRCSLLVTFYDTGCLV